jgi:hypothetical protein
MTVTPSAAVAAGGVSPRHAAIKAFACASNPFESVLNWGATVTVGSQCIGKVGDYGKQGKSDHDGD